MQDRSADPSRQMDSDPTGQPETYECHLCGKTFTSEIYYSDHLKLHDTGYNYPCCHCNLKFISVSDKHQHVEKYHKNVCFKCNKCDKVFVDSNFFENHKKICHYDDKKASKPKHDCGSEGKRKRHEWDNSDADSEDDKQEERPGSSRQMASGSTGDNIFISTPHPKNIQRLSREYPENIQSSSASSLSVFGIRALLRTPDENVGPSRQMASGSTGDNMQSESVGSSRQRDSNPTGQPETYKCNLCAQTFDSLNIFRNHLYYHSLENHPCYVCKLKFISYSELRKHFIFVHSDVSIKCDKCGKFFAHFDYFVQHKKRCHNNGKKDSKTKQKSKEKKCDNSDADSKDNEQEERPGPSRQMASGSIGDNMQGEGVGSSRQKDSDPTGQPETYKCNLCAQTFDSLNIFRNHLYYHSLENHPCYVCKLKFISYSELRKHCIRVHSDGSLKCDKCGKFFAHFDYFVQHKKRCHNNGKKDTKTKQKSKEKKCDNSDADSKDDKQEERPGPSRQMASGSTGDNIFISAPHPKNIQRLSREYPENIQSSSASSLSVFGIRALLRTPDEDVGPSRQMASSSTGDNMQSESVGSSRQRDSDPTEQPDNVGKESVTTEEQQLKQNKRRLELESLKMKEQELKRKKKKLGSKISDADSKDDMPEERSDPSRQMASGSTGDNMQGEGVGSSRQRDSNPTGQPETYTCDFCAQTFDSSEILCNHLYYHSLENHPCYACELKFISKSLLRKHWNSVHPDVPIKCKKCGKVFAHFKSLVWHEKKYHNNNKEDSKTKQKSKRKKCDNSDADSKDNEQEERPGPSRQMASGSIGDNMQCESVGSSRQRDSDPTEQPDNVSKESVTVEEQKYELKRKQRDLERVSKGISIKKEREKYLLSNKRFGGDNFDADSKDNKLYKCDKCGKLFAKFYILKRHKRTVHNNGKEASKPKQDCGLERKRKRLEWDHSEADLKDNEQEKGADPSRQMDSGSTGDNMQAEGVDSSRQMDSDLTGQPDNAHTRSSHTVGRWKCDFCTKSFADLRLLSQHEKKEHKKEKEMRDGDAGPSRQKYSGSK
ncbi:zinc finger protein 91-like [Nylanderia fulva]|uniref:zinc finger protein 91-like n=1 Tax=Nylanderia fulva TaxID=613905 RepID=UPI0010FB4475|nr:zinc finger protein 91-like [Nylanderia fulva]